MLLSNLRQRLARDEGGFTLIELLVVLIIIAVLLAIAVPSYLGFKDRAEKRAAGSNVRAAIPAAEAYYSDVGSYASMALTSGQAPATGGLKGIDQGISNTLVVVASADGKSYCLSSTVGNHTAKVNGPGGVIDSEATAACS